MPKHPFGLHEVWRCLRDCRVACNRAAASAQAESGAPLVRGVRDVIELGLANDAGKAVLLRALGDAGVGSDAGRALKRDIGQGMA